MIQPNNFLIIKNQWQKLIELNKSEDTEYHLYLHAPFCVKACKYCIYTGKLITDSDYKEEYDNYINKYLSRAIYNYRDILNKKAPKSFYFGGGTPNLIKPDDLRKIFDSIPNFNNIKLKVADINPCYLSKETLQVFIDYKFTTLCFGVQSFDKETCVKNNRDCISKEKLEDILKVCHENNIYTSIDIMTFLNHYNEKDIDILKEDLDIATAMDIDFIAINPNLHFILNNEKYSSIFNSYVDHYMEKQDKYIAEKRCFKLDDVNELNERSIYRIVNKKVQDKYKDEILVYFADDFPFATNNIIGIGDMNNVHSTMSYIHGKLFYTEKNINNEPNYDIKYFKNDISNINNSLISLKNSLKKIST